MLKSGEIYFHGTNSYPFKPPFKENGLIWFTQDLSYATEFIWNVSSYDKRLTQVVVAKVKFNKPLKLGRSELPLLNNGKLSNKTSKLCQILDIPEKEVLKLYDDIKQDIEGDRPVWISDLINKPMFKEYLVKKGYDSVIAIESEVYTLGVANSSQIEFIKQGVSEEESDRLLFEDKQKDSEFVSICKRIMPKMKDALKYLEDK